MNSESRLIAEVWETVRDTIPAAKRLDTAMTWLRLFEEYGFDSSDFADLVTEDKILSEAYSLLFDEPVEEDDEYEDE
ncbi:MAG: hypothetical protein ABI207_07925 [Crocinitomicaceae bacterium]